MKHTTRAVVLAAAVVALSAASAQAATKTVFAGPSGTAGGVFSQTSPAELNTFSLKQVTIHVGDKVKWIINGFHTVTFPKKGGGDIPFFARDTAGSKVAGVNDAAGTPFFFNGQTQVLFDPRALQPQGGKTEDGSKITGSGVSQGNGTPPPYILKFTKPGTYQYECVVHPGMVATVKVVAKGKPIPSAAADRKTAKKLLTAWAKTAKKLEAFTPPANTVSGGNDNKQIAILQFFPSTIHVPVGGSVNFSVTSPVEIHTLTFGPDSYLTPLANNFLLPPATFNPQIVFPSDPGPLSYNGTTHGNGFFNTGIQGAGSGKVTGLPTTQSITFTKAGTYSYICLIHPFMKATVVVG